MDLRTALGRYRLMAYIVGTMLILVFAFIPISQKVEGVIGPIHGALYIVYLLTVLQLWREARLRLWIVVAMVTAGWVPFVAFIAERWVTKHIGSAETSAVPDPL